MWHLIFAYLFALVSSAPQGYRYAENIRKPHSVYGPIKTPPDAISNETLNSIQALIGNINSNSIEQNIENRGDLHHLAIATNTLDATYDASPPAQVTQQQPQISKRFFVHSAPEEDDEEEVIQREITVGKPHKYLNVVFIKSSLKSAQHSTIKIRPAVNQEKTVIYVLKKLDSGEFETHVVEPVATTAKPEVYFIKYKTNEEAEHAQRSIQSQYGTLGGTTKVSNEGFAQVSSVIGALDNAKYATDEDDAEEFANPEDYQSHHTESSNFAGKHNDYLPPL